MTKAGNLNWDDLYKNGHSSEPEHPLSKPLKKGQNGEESINESFSSLTKGIIEGSKQDGIRQPTDKEMFGHLEVTEEMVKKDQDEWDNKLGNWYEEAQKPLEKNNTNENWEPDGTSFLDDLSEEEKEAYENGARAHDSQYK